MDRETLLKLIEAGDRYGLMLEAIRAWFEAYHQEVDRAVLIAYRGDDLLSLRIPVPVNRAAA